MKAQATILAKKPRRKKLEVALFDMTGTTVNDVIRRPDLEEPLPLVISAYQDAFKAGGIEMPFDELNDCRGRDKREVFEEKVKKYRTNLAGEDQLALADRLHDSFVTSLLRDLEYVHEMPGTSEVFKYLKGRGIFVAIGSGFPYVVAKAINEKLAWKEMGLVDFVTCGESVGGGRPRPNMINHVLVSAGYLPKGIDLSKPVGEFDYSIVLKVGDTVKDMEEALNVGARALAVLTGTQGREKLERVVGKGRMIQSIRELPEYLERRGYI